MFFKYFLKTFSFHETKKEPPEKSTLYKKKETTPPTQQNSENKNNIKLTVNTHKEKLKALERFKSTKKPERRRFKGAAKKVINLNRATKPMPKFPPGMDAEKKQAPNTPPPPPIVAQQQLSKQKPREGDDLV